MQNKTLNIIMWFTFSYKSFNTGGRANCKMNDMGFQKFGLVLRFHVPCKQLGTSKIIIHWISYCTNTVSAEWEESYRYNIKDMSISANVSKFRQQTKEYIFNINCKWPHLNLSLITTCCIILEAHRRDFRKYKVAEDLQNWILNAR